MTDNKSAYATSEYVSSVDGMSFSYSDTQSFIGVGCENDST